MKLFMLFIVNSWKTCGKNDHDKGVIIRHWTMGFESFARVEFTASGTFRQRHTQGSSLSSTHDRHPCYPSFHQPTICGPESLWGVESAIQVLNRPACHKADDEAENSL